MALAGMVLTSTQGHALTLETMSLPFGLGPEREGVLSWRTLTKAVWIEGQGVMFPPEIAELDGAEVRLEGFMMPISPEPLQRQFLLTAYAAHCMFCMPGGMPSLVEVLPRQPVPHAGGRLTMQGRFELRHDVESYGLLYRMLDAMPAA